MQDQPQEKKPQNLNTCPTVEEKLNETIFPFTSDFLKYLRVDSQLKSMEKEILNHLIRIKAYVVAMCEKPTLKDGNEAECDCERLSEAFRRAEDEICNNMKETGNIHREFIKELVRFKGKSKRNLLKVLKSYRYIINLNKLTKKKVDEEEDLSNCFNLSLNTTGTVDPASVPSRDMPDCKELPKWFKKSLDKNLFQVKKRIQKREELESGIFDYEGVIEGSRFERYTPERKEKVLTELNIAWEECVCVANEQFEKEYLLPHEKKSRQFNRKAGISPRFFAARPYPDHKERSFNAIVYEHLNDRKECAKSIPNIIVSGFKDRMRLCSGRAFGCIYQFFYHISIAKRKKKKLIAEVVEGLMAAGIHREYETDSGQADCDSSSDESQAETETE